MDRSCKTDASASRSTSGTKVSSSNTFSILFLSLFILLAAVLVPLILNLLVLSLLIVLCSLTWQNPGKPCKVSPCHAGLHANRGSGDTDQTVYPQETIC